MDNESFEQTELSSDFLKEELNSLKEGIEKKCTNQTYEGETIRY